MPDEYKAFRNQGYEFCADQEYQRKVTIILMLSHFYRQNILILNC